MDFFVNQAATDPVLLIDGWDCACLRETAYKSCFHVLALVLGCALEQWQRWEVYGTLADRGQIWLPLNVARLYPSSAVSIFVN